MGSPVRTSGRKDDPGSRHQDRLPLLGLSLDLELDRGRGRQFAQAHRKVRYNKRLPYFLGDSKECIQYRPPLIQTSPERMKLFVFATLLVSFIAYARFCVLVINDITDYMGIACFTVRKRNQKGDWSKTEQIGLLDGKGH